MTQLWKTYEYASRSGAFDEPQYPLTEVGFIRKRADIMVTLNADGSFCEAERLEHSGKGKRDDAESVMVIPTTATAEGRTSSIAPYPLLDQLVYLAGDGYKGKGAKCFEAYFAELTDWASESDAPQALQTFQRYIAKRRLVHDLQAFGLKLDPAKDKKLFLGFRLRVRDGDGDSEKLWERKDIRESWRRRCTSRLGEPRLCYVEGELKPILNNHPKLMGSGKLISSQDTGTIFQYKGRFTQPDEAAMVSYDASIKAHNALLWLLKRQGFNRYGMQAIAWTTGGDTLDLPIRDSGGFDDEDETGAAQSPLTFEEFGQKVASMLNGRMQKLTGYRQGALDEVNLLALEAATLGRISVIYYQELPGGEYVKRLQKWYSDCSWGFARFTGSPDNRKIWSGISTPTPYEIAVAVYGKRQAETARNDLQSDKSVTRAVRSLKLRLLHCMVDEAPLPKDIERAAFHRVTAPMSFTDSNGNWLKYDWDLALSTYCALLHKQQEEKKDQDERKDKVTKVGLDFNCDNRSYLYGRMLAVVDAAERNALGKDNYRDTNAFRYMQLFQQRPFTTWTKLHTLVLPYFSKLREKSNWYRQMLEDITALFREKDFESVDPLDGRYLQGFYCQRQYIYTKKEERDKLTAPDNNEGGN